MCEEKEINFNNAKKTKVDKKVKEISAIHKGKLRNNLKMTQDVKDIVERISIDNLKIQELSEEAQFLEVFNRAELNKYLNLCLTGSMDSLVKLQGLNNAFLDKVTKKKSLISAKDSARLYIKLKELENNQIKLITELSKSQQFTLDEFEREVIIIFRSIPNELKKYLYTTILEFVKQCPKIQKAMIKTKQNQERKEKEENQLRKEVEKPI